MPNDPMLVRHLDERVFERLGQEFAEQTVRLQLDRITTVEAGSHYLRIDASGIADFGPEGTSSARIEALYDLREDAWLRVDYVLGPGAGLLPGLDALAGRCPVDTLFLQKKLPRLRGQGVRRWAYAQLRSERRGVGKGR